MNKAAVLLGVAMMALCGPLAQASIQISYSIDGGVPVVCSSATNSVVCPDTTGTGLDLQVLAAGSNSPGTASLSKETSTTLDITNSDLLKHTITISIVAPGFNTPLAPPALTLLSHIGGTVVKGSADNTLSFQSCIDQTNSATAGCPGTFQSGVSTPSITGTGSFQDDKTGFISSLAASYAIDEAYTITLGAGADINFSASTSLTPTPEPMSIALLGGVILLTSRVIRRKRNQTVQA
jgi:hypothetical protein